MDVNDLRNLVTLVLFVLFVCIVGWVMAPRNKARFEEAEQLPFLDQPRATTTPKDAA